MVHAKLPRAGLANKLLVWANAYLFAHKNNIPLLTTGWLKIHLGPVIRKEKSKRLYWNYFKANDFVLTFKFYVLGFFYNKVENPEILSTSKSNTIYLFNKVPHSSDYFVNIRENRILIKKAFFSNLSESTKEEINQHPIPLIAAHIRMGDFRAINWNEDSKPVGAIRTPLEYFIDIFKSINKLSGSKYPITIFSDGHENELKEILELPNVKLYNSNKDIIDLILISKAKVIITSAGSTFSYWAAYISEASIIHHPEFNYQQIRAKEEKELYEGEFSKDALASLLQEITPVEASYYIH